MHRGYVKLWRKTADNFLATNPTALALWVHLLWECNHKDREFLFNGKKTVCRRGEFITGRKKLSLLTGISQTTIERFLNVFESEGIIGQQKNNKFRRICIKNYALYQGDGQQMDNKWTTNGHLVDTTNNDKNDKNDKNVASIATKIPENWFNLFILWLDYKKTKCQKYKTESSMMSCFKKLVELSGDNIENAKRIIEQSIAFNYSGLFALKGGANQKSEQPKSKAERTMENAREYLENFNSNEIDKDSRAEGNVINITPF